MVTCAVVTFAANAAAETTVVSGGPGWEVTSRMYPTHLAPGQEGTVVVEVYNTGAAASTGPVTLTDLLPPGLEATSAGPLNETGSISESAVESREKAYAKKEAEQAEGKTTLPQSQPRVWACEVKSPVTCTTVPGYEGIERPLDPGYRGRIGIAVKAVGGPAVEENKVTVSGGGAAEPAETTDPLTISPTPAGFGLAGEFDGWFSTAGGLTDIQAGSHPYDLTLSFGLNMGNNGYPTGPLRDIKVAFPAGVVGDPHATAQCTREQFLSTAAGGCPPDTAVGVDEASRGVGFSGDFDVLVAVYNLVPPAGVPAEFGFTIFGTNVLIDAGVRSGSDYGITAAARNLGYEAAFNTITLWGVPGESSHDRERCGIGPSETGVHCGFKATGASPRPLLTLPTSCEGPLTTTLTIDSWDKSLGSASESFMTHDPSGAPVGYTGCEHLAFPPSLTVAPDTSYADTPAGLTVDVKVPQEGLTSNKGLSTANIEGTTVTLPEGVAVNPGQAAGLLACGSEEDGLTTPVEEAAGEEDDGPAHCPNASQVGTDEIETPLLAKPLKGDVYVLNSNPPHLKLLVAAEGEGVFLKLIGDVNLDEATGRLVTTFEKTPELPFTDFKLSFSGGAQAALTTPVRCGTYATTSDFAAWSSPLTADVFPESEFTISSGPGGSGCLAGTLPFSPELTAGSTTDQAGGYTGFSLLLQRGDGQQRIEKLQFKAPQGLSGMLSSVPLCEEPQAAAGTCSSSSQIGHSVVSSGPGPYPLVIPQPGQPESPIYLTGPYDGAPFGLSIVTHVIAGPFNLGTIVTRAKIEVDPHTAQITVTTEPLPQVIDGVPTDLREVDAVIDRKGFMFNPTSCEPASFSGTAWGAVPPGAGGESSTAAIASRFQVGSCRGLTFEPELTASTKAKHTRKLGAYFHVAVKSSFGDANIKEVHVELPKALPSELRTLQHACIEQQFAANPAGCPDESVVGHAVIHTPLLPVPLEGPAYFVSHGGAKFPELVLVLQGDGVTIQLNGETFISKAGITTSTFKSVPDQPFESFDLTLPQREYSALGATSDFCKHPQVMPTRIVGQNGAVIEQNTPIEVEGCSNALSLTAKVKGRKVKAKVYVPAAGRVTLSGKGLVGKTMKVDGREALALTLRERKAGSLRTRLRLAYTPAAGKDRKKQTKSIPVRFK
jgi:uncharacterized repeat protein (TIGR01451 family)